MRRRGDQRDARHGMAQTRDKSRHFVARKLSALSGLGTLGNFDLNLFGAAQIGRSYTESSRCDLFDFGIFYGTESCCVFTALSAV